MRGMRWDSAVAFDGHTICKPCTQTRGMVRRTVENWAISVVVGEPGGVFGCTREPHLRKEGTQCRMF